jgi:L-threonylcarbamoyladenylate synthase
MIEISTDINKAAYILQQEDVIGIPTETVYGLAGNVFSHNAVHKIFALKNRPLFNPLIVHISNKNQLTELATDIPDIAWALANAYWPGPLTLLLPKHPSVPDLVTGGKPTIAVRIPNHPLTLSLLNQLSFPLAAPSANPFGSISPTQALHVANYFSTTLSLILDGGACKNGLESTIIGFQNKQPVLYRLGSITAEALAPITGKLETITNNDKAPEAPGMLSKHYAPKTKTILAKNIDQLIEENSHKRLGLLLFQQAKKLLPNWRQEILSPTGQLEEAAANLYAAMHKLDKEELDLIIAEYFPDEGLGKTINDRLNRATTA